jgi:hypothetical protein
VTFGLKVDQVGLVGEASLFNPSGSAGYVGLGVWPWPYEWLYRAGDPHTARTRLVRQVSTPIALSLQPSMCHSRPYLCRLPPLPSSAAVKGASPTM